MDRYLVISSEGHAGPRPGVYRDYLDPKYRAAFDDAFELQMAQMQKIAIHPSGGTWSFFPSE